MTTQEINTMYGLMMKFQMENNKPAPVQSPSTPTTHPTVTLESLLGEVQSLRQQISAMNAAQIQQAPQTQHAQPTVQQTQAPGFDFDKAFNDIKNMLFMQNMQNMQNTQPNVTIDTVTAEIIDPPLPDFGQEPNGGKMTYGK